MSHQGQNLEATTDPSPPRRPRRSPRWQLAVVVLASMVAAVLAPISVDRTEAGVASVDTSMVEMLGEVDPSSVMTMANLRQMIANSSQVTTAGNGIDVAVIDTGVAPVPGLDGSDKVLHGPDLSFEGSSSQAAYLDTFGHGTHMAAIIAGDRPDAPGIAPGARIVSVKVAGHDGITTVPQVVAAIDWVIEHRNSDGMNIRVLNLSLGQAGVSSHVGDHLSAAVERAWDAGIVVVVAAGNRGQSQKHLDSPAIDPYVISVGALDSVLLNGSEDLVPGWSANGDGNRNPDTVAPGRSVASYRVPGSTIDDLVPEARVGDDFFLGSGTSQAAAVTSGVVAAMLQYHPEYTPDKVKATLEYRADEVDPNSEIKDGEGAVNGVYSVVYGGPSSVTPQSHSRAAGPGTGIVTPSGATWSGGSWTGGTWSGATWSGATWSGGTWSGATWSGATWSGATWSGATWSGGTWSGATWSGATWSGATWSGATWSGNGWS